MLNDCRDVDGLVLTIIDNDNWINAIRMIYIYTSHLSQVRNRKKKVCLSTILVRPRIAIEHECRILHAKGEQRRRSRGISNRSTTTDRYLAFVDAPSSRLPNNAPAVPRDLSYYLYIFVCDRS